MNSFGPTWSYTKFKSKNEAREYCLSEACERNISYLDGLSYSLSEKAQLEVPVCHGHGYPMEAPSSIEASYVNSEANRLRTLRKYFKGVDPSPGYKWVYDNDRHDVHQEIDTSNLSDKHPVFLEYFKEQNLTKKDKKEAYDLWSSQFNEHNNGMLGNMNIQFKLAYHFKMKNLIPDGMVLDKPIKKK